MKKKTLIPLIVLATAAVATAEPPRDLLPELKKGGYVLFVRHPRTNPDQADTDPLNLDNIKAQRELSDDGRKQARALGESFRALQIPVEKVISSKFHRAQEGAKLLAVGEITTSVDVSEGGLVVSTRENQRRAKALRQLLSTPPAKGKNLVVVSHKPNLQDAAGKEFGDLDECEVVVFRPLGDGKFQAVARVGSEAWSQWAK
ncbi:MAG TPA: histidine phosphatase family protein [Gemmataceae bacterium]|nr:histidine phosphatase family protein [Gemmataceae bacterium]